MSRAFLDANVLFSAAHSSRGVARGLFELAYQHEDIVSLVVTEHVLVEATENLQGKYPRRVPDLLSLLDGVGYVPEPPEELMLAVAHLLTDPEDIPVLAGALFADADILLTGDRRHFGHLYGGAVGGCAVMELRAGFEKLLREVEDGE